MADSVDDKFNPVKVGELTDERGLYGEFRSFRAETRTAFEMLTMQLLPLIKRQGEEIDDLKERVTATEARITALEDRPKRKR